MPTPGGQHGEDDRRVGRPGVDLEAALTVDDDLLEPLLEEAPPGVGRDVAPQMAHPVDDLDRVGGRDAGRHPRPQLLELALNAAAVLEVRAVLEVAPALQVRQALELCLEEPPPIGSR